MKREYGKGLEPGDIDLQGSNLWKLLFFSFIGGFVAGGLGLGGGSIFNPLLLEMGVPPKVASASGMYMIIFSTGASTTTYLIEGMLKIDYGLWVGGFNVFGTIVGMFLLSTIMKKMNRQSPLVFLLVVIFLISVVAVPIFGFQKIFAGDHSKIW